MLMDLCYFYFMAHHKLLFEQSINTKFLINQYAIRAIKKKRIRQMYGRHPQNDNNVTVYVFNSLQ